MLNAIIRFSVRNKLVIGLFTLAWIIWGTIQLLNLPVDALPDITSNQVQVITVSPTLGSLEVERLISFPIEQASSNIPGIKEIRSISRFGLSVVTIVFEDDRDIYWCRQQVSERMSMVKDEIPKEAGSPELAPVTTGLGEIYQYVVKPKKGYEQQYDLTELRTIQDWIIRRQLMGTPGVADVSSFGGRLKQYEVAVDPARMRSLGVSLTDIFNALEKNNQNSGAAYIEKGPSLLFIRTEGLAKSIEEISTIYLSRSAAGTPIFIRDVAEVRIGSPIRYGALTFEDKGEVSGAVVLMLKGENASQVIQGIEKRMKQIEKTLPEGVEVKTFLNRTKMVGRTLNTVKTNLLEGALIVLLVLVFFLGNLRAGLIVASVIPLSMLFAVSMMNLFGVSGNLMSLGALDFGLIVDGAVIIVEAVLHRLHSNNKGLLKLNSSEMNDTVEKAAGKMMNAAVFGQVIILIVYIPILSLSGIEGKMFKPMAQTVAFALVGAFILSLTYVPMITSLGLSKKLSGKENISDRMMSSLQLSFKKVLSKFLLHPAKIVTVSLGLFVLSLFIAFSLGGEFIPELEEGDFAIDARLMTGSSLQETVDATTKAVTALKKFPEVKSVVTRIGASEIPTDPMPIEMTDIIVNLKDKSEWTSAESYDELANKMSAAIGKVPGLTGGFQYPVQMRFNELIAGAKQDVVCKIFGENLDTLARYAAAFEKVINTVEGAKDIFAERVTGLPQVVIKYKKQAIASYGLNIADVNRMLRASFAGEVTGQIYENERRFDLVVRLNKANRDDLTDLKQLMLTTGDGRSIPLDQVAEVVIEEGPNQVQREDAKRRISIAFNVRDRDVQSVVEEVQSKIDRQVKLPPGYYVQFGGQFENLSEAKNRLMIAVPLALLLILLILYFSFGSIRYGLLIYSAIPLSAIGGILFLWLRDMPFSISAGIGFIALFGVAVLNGIVLISEFNSLKLKQDNNLNVDQIALEGTVSRLRPVLMTAAVASLGFLPMALSTSSGAEVQRPLATVVIGGLISATLLTLFVLPVLYVWVEKKKQRKMKHVLISLFILVVPTLVHAQTTEKVLALDSILKYANDHAYILKIDDKRILQNELLKSRPLQTPNTSLGMEYGNINSAFNDTRFFLNQGLQLPVIYKRQKEVYQKNIEIEQARKYLNKAELHLSIRQLAYRIMDLERRAKILDEFESNFKQWRDVAQVQTSQGEIKKSVYNEIDFQYNQNRIQKEQLVADRAQLCFELKLLANSNEHLVPLLEDISTNQLSLITLEKESGQHPSIQFSNALVEERKALVLLNKSKLIPDVNLGYSNLSIIGWQTPDGVSQKYYGAGRRFGVYQFGLSLPLFNGSTKAKIKTAELDVEIAQLEQSRQAAILNTQLSKLISKYNQAQKSYQYYQNEALPISNELYQQASMRLKNGDISFSDWNALVGQSLQIKLAHVSSIYDMQMAMAEYIYLTEKN
jgi:cobalt-zinc-cadmium resistance protein CzcA